MNNASITNKRIPSLVGFVVLIGSVFVVSWMSTHGILFKTRAAPSSTPKNVQMTNKTDTSFTVTFTTDDSVIGSLSYGTDEKKLTDFAFDQRDEGKTQNTYHVHAVTVTHLSPRTTYFFTINSGGASYLKDGASYRLTTSTVYPSIDENGKIAGSVILPDGTKASDTLILLSLQGAEPISALVTSDGDFSLPLADIHLADGTGIKKLSAQDIMMLQLTNGTLTSSVKLPAVSSRNLPTISLSQNYDFTEQSKAEGSASTSASVTFGDLASGIIPDTSSTEPSIISPGDNESVHDLQPNFSGTAVPNTPVSITVTAGQVETTVTADNTGHWQFRPTTPLTPGVHSLTIRAKNSTGIQQTLTQSFTVLADGTQFLDPSVSPTSPTPTTAPIGGVATSTPTPSPTILPTVIPTVQVTVTPTSAPIGGILTETPTITATPTIIPTATPLPPSPTPLTTISRAPPPVTGSSDTIGIGIAALSAMLFGSILFFLSRKNTSL